MSVDIHWQDRFLTVQLKRYQIVYLHFLLIIPAYVKCEYLGGSSDHVLDEISVTWGIDDGDFVFWDNELPESDIDGDTSFTFGLKFVHNPGIFEGTFTFLQKGEM